MRGAASHVLRDLHHDLTAGHIRGQLLFATPAGLAGLGGHRHLFRLDLFHHRVGQSLGHGLNSGNSGEVEHHLVRSRLVPLTAAAEPLLHELFDPGLLLDQLPILLHQRLLLLGDGREQLLDQCLTGVEILGDGGPDGLGFLLHARILLGCPLYCKEQSLQTTEFSKKKPRSQGDRGSTTGGEQHVGTLGNLTPRAAVSGGAARCGSTRPTAAG